MLDQVKARGGALELAVRAPGSAADPTTNQPSADVMWRVRLVEVSDAALSVEAPMACGRAVAVAPGAALVVALTIGQNRWMFESRVLAQRPGFGGLPTLAIALPESVERCSRREAFRISTVRLNLPRVLCWPLLDPTTVVAAEAANRMQVRELAAGGRCGTGDELALDPMVLPNVGPRFEARLLNMSGGGLGLILGPAEAAAADRHGYVWLQLDLRPRVAAPLAITAKKAHSHLDSGGNTYLGLAFDFTHNPEHQRFIFETINGYIGSVQGRAADGNDAAAA
jgi:c-di-GMP-binding flagellar brake protein YcgR